MIFRPLRSEEARLPATAPKIVALTLLSAVAACGRSTPAASPGPAPAPTGAVAAQLLSPDIIGTSERLAVRILGVGVDPSRAVFELSQASYVTLISVTATTIEAIVPGNGVRQQIVAGGLHVAVLRQLDSTRFGVADRFGARAGVLEDNVGAAELLEYNRCLANARLVDARRRQAVRPVVGRDSAGRPIYGEAPPTDPRQESERYCRMPASRAATGAGSAGSAGSADARTQGRYLLLYASDTPITSRDIVNLTISEGDPRSITEVIGRRLFGARGAQWSGAFAPF